MPLIGQIPGTIDDRLAELAGAADGTPAGVERDVLEEVKAGRLSAEEAPGEVYVRQAALHAPAAA